MSASPSIAEADLDAISKKMDALTDNAEGYSAEVLGRAGAILVPDHYGRVRTERGIVRPEDAKPAAE